MLTTILPSSQVINNPQEIRLNLHVLLRAGGTHCVPRDRRARVIQHFPSSRFSALPSPRLGYASTNRMKCHEKHQNKHHNCFLHVRLAKSIFNIIMSMMFQFKHVSQISSLKKGKNLLDLAFLSDFATADFFNLSNFSMFATMDLFAQLL